MKPSYQLAENTANNSARHFKRLGTLTPPVTDDEEIGNIAAFLASEGSSFVNGTTLVADGGWTAY